MSDSPNDPIFLESLSEAHNTATFRCGASFLDWYLAHRALSDQQAHLSRTTVAVNDPAADAPPDSKRIEGYVTLETGAMPTATLLRSDGTLYFPQHQISVVPFSRIGFPVEGFQHLIHKEGKHGELNV
jgi:hypothetical protein